MARDYVLRVPVRAAALSAASGTVAVFEAPGPEIKARVPDGAFVRYVAWDDRTDVEGDEEPAFEMQRFNGRHTALLVRSEARDRVGLAHIRRVLEEQDIVYETLRDLLGTEPSPANPEEPDLLTVAWVDTTCGHTPWACGSIGGQGIELGNGVSETDNILSVTHEMLHNFDHVSRLLFNGGDYSHVWTSFWEYYIWAYLQKTFGFGPDDTLELGVRETIEPYEEWPGANWQACVADAACGPADEEGRSAFVRTAQAGVLLRLAQLHGRQAMRAWPSTVNELVEERGLADADLRPEQRVDLFQESLGRALGVNVSCYFDYWRWPVSGLVRGPLEQLFGANPNCADNDGDGLSEVAYDCNDQRRDIHRNAVESANGLDDDCDGLVDDVHQMEPPDFPATREETPTLATRAHVRGAYGPDDMDYFRVVLSTPTYLRLMVRSSSGYGGDLWFDALPEGVEWLRTPNRVLLKGLFGAGEWAFRLPDTNTALSHEFTVQPDQPLPANADYWPITFTPAPGAMTTTANRYRLPPPPVPPTIAATPGLMTRYWVTGAGYVGSVSGIAPFEWTAPEGTDPRALTYRAQFITGASLPSPVYPMSQPAGLVGNLPWAARDIGGVGQPGAAVRFAETDFTLRGAGADIGGSAEAFQYSYLPLDSDGEVVARVVGLGATNTLAKTGVMIRESFAAGARHASMTVSAGRNLGFQYRSSTNGSTSTTGAGTAAVFPYWVRVTRQGSSLTAYHSADGRVWSRAGSVSLSMSAPVLAGVAVTSRNASSLATAGLDHVSVRPLRVALLVVGSTSLTAADAAVRSRLEALGFVVVTRAGSAVTSADANGKALVAISSTVTPSSVNTKLRSVAVPVMSWEAELFDDLGMTGVIVGSDFGVSGGQTQVMIAAADHPMAAGLSGWVIAATTSSTFSWGRPNANATVAATLASQPARAALFGYEQGAAMVGATAPAKRVGLFLENTTASALSAEGAALFDAATLWAATR